MKTGKVYIIRSPGTERVYIGSTKNSLSKRFSDHKRDPTQTYAHVVFKAGNAYIELLEEIPYTDRTELETLEYSYIRKYGCRATNYVGRGSDTKNNCVCKE